MPQAVQIETQAKQQGLPHLHRQAAAWSASRELALGRREDPFDQSPAVESLRKCPPHFGTHSVDAPSFFPALGGDHALSSELLADVGMISFAVEFGVGQDQADRGSLRGCFDNHRQIGTVVPRAPSCGLRQQKVLIQIRHHHPLQPLPPRQRLFARDDAVAARRTC